MTKSAFALSADVVRKGRCGYGFLRVCRSLGTAIWYRGFVTTLPRKPFSRAEWQKSSGLRPLIVLLDDILVEYFPACNKNVSPFQSLNNIW